MTLSTRSRISLFQFLELFEYDLINVLLEKYSFTGSFRNFPEIKNIIKQEDTTLLINEIVSTRQELRSRITPKYKFEERWSDFKRCLLLDGYKIEDDKIISIEPNIEGLQAIEDDLTNEILRSSLTQKDDIVKLINASAESFKKNTPDYNECLSKVRISLETLVKNITMSLTQANENWGRSLKKLKENGFISNNEEQAISSTYTYVSDGSHIPLGFTEEEYARYGRNLILSVCYYIIKKFNHNSSGIDLL